MRARGVAGNMEKFALRQTAATPQGVETRNGKQGGGGGRRVQGGASAGVPEGGERPRLQCGRGEVLMRWGRGHRSRLRARAVPKNQPLNHHKSSLRHFSPASHAGRVPKWAPYLGFLP